MMLEAFGCMWTIERTRCVSSVLDAENLLATFLSLSEHGRSAWWWWDQIRTMLQRVTEY